MNHPTESPDFVPDTLPDDIATPEGDNEPFTSDPPPIERPRGNEPHPSQPIRPAQD